MAALEKGEADHLYAVNPEDVRKGKIALKDVPYMQRGGAWDNSKKLCEKLGLNKMAVHMFIFYWGMLSSITPPVAIASFAAAGIAGSPAMKTGWESMWVGSIIYFIPFFFVLNPVLVLQGPSPYLEALGLLALAAAGTLFICGGIQGYQPFVGDLRGAGALEWPIRVLLVIGGFVVATPGGGIMPLSQYAKSRK